MIRLYINMPSCSCHERIFLIYALNCDNLYDVRTTVVEMAIRMWMDTSPSPESINHNNCLI